MRRKFVIGWLVLATIAMPAKSLAWGYEGHKVIAAIARSYLSPTARANADALLAADPDTLTAPDFISRATWADAWRASGHRETAQWHYVDIELDNPDPAVACFGAPAPFAPASAGPAQDCVVDRVNAFSAELRDPHTPQSERILALKYLLHLVGDMHQPLHAADNHDRGGNCVLVSLGGSRTQNLHSYWDTAVVEALGRDPVALANELRAHITPAKKSAWERGSARDWAIESFGVAKSVAYRSGTTAGCGSYGGPITLPPGYEEAAKAAAAQQLERAGVRLAMILNRDLANMPKGGGSATSPGGGLPANVVALPRGRSAKSIDCSHQADAMGLHGRERQAFRRACIRS
jgi:hypothetical protein